MTPALRHVTKISSLSPKEIRSVLKLALEMKARAGVLCPRGVDARQIFVTLWRTTGTRAQKRRAQDAADVLREAESAHARLARGGHDVAGRPRHRVHDRRLAWGEKESYEDTGAVLSRMCDAVTARVKSREQVTGLAEARGSSTR